LNPPIGIFFETENIYTLNSNSEMSLSFISTLAQEESHNKSEIMNASVEMRFRRGIFLTPPLLGYDPDGDGNLVVNEEEAKTVRLIFFMYLYGYTCQHIADTLTKLGRRTKKDNVSWSPSSILQVLQNERHCGDVLARKTWTPSYLDHKSKRNRQDRNQYRQRNHHDAIISRDDFIAVQRLISNAKYGHKGVLPELHVIPSGALRGFVSINPRWAGFKVQDYQMASESVYDSVIQLPSKPLDVKIEAQEGVFDLRGFEIARSQFFNTQNRTSMTISIDQIIFSIECIRKMGNVLFVQLLIHPSEHLLVVRPCQKETKNAVQWAKIPSDSDIAPRVISGAAFLKTIYEMFGWKTGCRYRISGLRRQKDEDSVLVFDMHDTEIFIPSESLTAEKEDETSESPSNGVEPLTETKKSVLAYPAAWADGFGYNFYTHAQAQELASLDADGDWDVRSEGTPFSSGQKLQVTSQEEIGKNIREIIGDMKQEDDHEQ
jgi:hypothetical protein